jgi:hypothetical protein
MEMLNEINKLLTEYQLKINDCDTLLDKKYCLIGENRQAKNHDVVAAIRKEKAIIEAKKQAYVQAKSDIDSLLDYLPQN